jgi:hypothetical protein
MTDTVQQPADQTAQSNDLTINDLNAMKVIIDIASSRGAFKPNEMIAVGQTYTKLTTFLDGVAAQQAAQPEQPAPATAPTAPATGA